MQGLRHSFLTRNTLRTLTRYPLTDLRALFSPSTDTGRREFSTADAESSSSRGKRLGGKVALITGAGNGIGKATAQLFAEEGAKVLLADVNEQGIISLAAELGGEERALYRRCDVSKEEEVTAAVEAAVAKWARLDIMYNNAGIGGSHASICDLKVADFEACAAVNVGGVLAGIREAAKAMKAASTKGCIINTASSAALLGGLGPPGYSATKAAVISLTRSAAAELGPYGIRVNSISPGAVPTSRWLPDFQKAGFQGSTVEDISEALQLHDPFQGLPLTSAMVAQVALFLADDRSGGYITGHNLVVDGGLTATANHDVFGFLKTKNH